MERAMFLLIYSKLQFCKTKLHFSLFFVKLWSFLSSAVSRARNGDLFGFSSWRSSETSEDCDPESGRYDVENPAAASGDHPAKPLKRKRKKPTSTFGRKAKFGNDNRLLKFDIPFWHQRSLVLARTTEPPVVITSDEVFEMPWKELLVPRKLDVTEADADTPFEVVEELAARSTAFRSSEVRTNTQRSALRLHICYIFNTEDNMRAAYEAEDNPPERVVVWSETMTLRRYARGTNELIGHAETVPLADVQRQGKYAEDDAPELYETTEPLEVLADFLQDMKFDYDDEDLFDVLERDDQM